MLCCGNLCGETRLITRVRANRMNSSTRSKSNQGRSNALCLVRFYCEVDITSQTIPAPYSRSGTGNVFYITTRLSGKDSDKKLIPLQAKIPPSLIQVFEESESCCFGCSICRFLSAEVRPLENVVAMAQKHKGRDEDILLQLICAVVGMGYQLSKQGKEIQPCLKAEVLQYSFKQSHQRLICFFRWRWFSPGK